MKLAIGSDKSGFVMKEAIAAYLKGAGIEFDDLGTTDINNPKPFYVVAPAVAPKVADGTYDRAVLICGTGAGMTILANKVKGVYAVACESIYAAKMCRAINDAQIMCMGGWVVGPEMGVEMTKTFLSTEFTQDLEPWRQDFLKNSKKEIKQFEDKTYVR